MNMSFKIQYRHFAARLWEFGVFKIFCQREKCSLAFPHVYSLTKKGVSLTTKVMNAI